MDLAMLFQSVGLSATALVFTRIQLSPESFGIGTSFLSSATFSDTCTTAFWVDMLDV